MRHGADRGLRRDRVAQRRRAVDRGRLVGHAHADPVDVGERVAVAHAAIEAEAQRVQAGVDGERGGAGLRDLDLLAGEDERAERLIVEQHGGVLGAVAHRPRRHEDLRGLEQREGDLELAVGEAPPRRAVVLDLRHARGQPARPAVAAVHGVGARVEERAAMIDLTRRERLHEIEQHAGRRRGGGGAGDGARAGGGLGRRAARITRVAAGRGEQREGGDGGDPERHPGRASYRSGRRDRT